jgi:hypothetical protein
MDKSFVHLLQHQLSKSGCMVYGEWPGTGPLFPLHLVPSSALTSAFPVCGHGKKSKAQPWAV